LGLVGAGIVVFHIFLALLEAVFGVDRRGSESASFGLLPVLAGFVILCAGLPIAALIWGARESDLFATWVFLRDGFAVGDSRISAGDALRLILIFAVLVSLTRFLQAVLRRAVLPRTSLDIGGQNAVVTGVGYLGITSAALAAITATGLDLSNIALVAGALSVGIGFGLQSIVSNFVAGIILLVERPIKQGDWIEVSGYSGYVRKISVRSTRIETFDRSNVIVPNQDLIAGTVLNYTHGSMVGRLIVKVSVAFGTDTKAVERVLHEIAQAHPMVLRNPEPAILFMGIAADRYEFEIRAILRDVNWVLNVRSDFNHAITRRFSEEGIVVPHVQTDVHVRSVASAPLQEAAE
ncbi:MAG: mechanosensitive ion channel domain-containing protein, partial [Pseudomonadota bacterium]